MLRCVTAAAIAAVTVIGIANASASQPLPRAAPVMLTGSEVMGPYAFYDFCSRTPFECQSDAKPLNLVTLSAEIWAQIVEVNDIVNQTVTPKSDLDNYGVPDYWAIASKYGDCEDYALTKQLYLRQRGLPMGALLMTVVLDEHGEGHAVLTVHTTRGDLILDNRRPGIFAWNDTPYKYIKRQSPLDPRIWLTLNATPVARNGDAVASTRSAHR